MKYPHVTARVFNTPLLIHPRKLDAIIAGLGARLIGRELVLEPTDLAGTGMQPEMFTTRKGERVREAGWPGYSNVDGVAVIPINGALVHKTQIDANSDLLLGYNDMAAATEHAMDNTDIHALLQVYDSPGGEVQGAFEFAQRMFDLRNTGKKPMYAIADGMAASAAYLGASAATDQLAVTKTGYAGSIGVVMRHVDFSRALANEGVAVNFIFAGAHKIDGNAFEPLPAAVRAEYQAEINKLYDMFVGAVARQTGLSVEAVRATEARVFMGEDAVNAGLARRVATADQLISELTGLRSRSVPVGQSARSINATTDKGNSMSGNQPPADGQPSATAITQADLETARAEGHAAGVKAERERASGILAHKEAEGRTALAIQCVANGLTPEASAAMLAASPKATAASPFAAAMGSLGNPNVRADGGAEAELTEPAAVGASWDRAFGVKQAAKAH